MKVCIKENEFNTNYHEVFGEEKAKADGYIIFEVPKGYEDCAFEDFDNNGFSYQRYNERKKIEKIKQRIEEIKPQMESLSQDFIQYYLGATIENIEERKARFISLHNELRELLGKQPRIYK